MGWSLAADWLTVVGLLFLTIGTVAQALANLAEYESLLQTASAAATAAVSTLSVVMTVGGGIGPDMPSWWYRYIPRWFALIPEILIGLGQLSVLIFAFSRATLTRLRNEGGEEAVELVPPAGRNLGHHHDRFRARAGGRRHPAGDFLQWLREPAQRSCSAAPGP
jgi:hypothetical protein